MSGDALPQPPAPSTDEREAAACAWADHRKDYGASTDPVLLKRDHAMFLSGYHDGRREQREADKIARRRQPLQCDYSTCAAPAYWIIEHPHGLPSYTCRQHPLAVGLIESMAPIPEQENPTVTSTDQDAWRPSPIPEGHPPLSPRQSLERLLGEALGAASTAWTGTPTGVFESERVLDIQRIVLDEVERYVAAQLGAPSALVETLDAEFVAPKDTPLAVHALQAATSLHMADAHDTNIDATGNSLASAARMLVWLRDNPDPGPVPDHVPAGLDIPALDAERIKAGSLAELRDGLDQIGSLVRRAQNTADVANRRGDDAMNAALAAQTRASEALDIARTAARSGTAAHADAATARGIAEQVREAVGAAQMTTNPGEPRLPEPSVSASFDGLAAGVYITGGLQTTQSPVVYVRSSGGLWFSTNAKNEEPHDGARRAYEQLGLTPLARTTLSLGVVGGERLAGTATAEQPEPTENADGQPFAEVEQLERHAEKQGVSYADAYSYFEEHGYDMSRAGDQHRDAD